VPLCLGGQNEVVDLGGEKGLTSGIKNDILSIVN
jgi:hypothetical protein